jgi:hypothetical protein
MKFYKNKQKKHNKYFVNFITISKLTTIYVENIGIYFFKNGKIHNTKNAAYINSSGYRMFYLNNKLYVYDQEFTKESWRKFVKLHTFL